MPQRQFINNLSKSPIKNSIKQKYKSLLYTESRQNLPVQNEPNHLAERSNHTRSSTSLESLLGPASTTNYSLRCKSQSTKIVSRPRTNSSLIYIYICTDYIFLLRLTPSPSWMHIYTSTIRSTKSVFRTLFLDLDRYMY